VLAGTPATRASPRREGIQSGDFGGQETRPKRLRPWFVSLQRSERPGDRLVGDAEMTANHKMEALNKALQDWQQSQKLRNREGM
jgi:hypothetical protein